MNDAMLVQVLQRLSNLQSDEASHVDRQRIVALFGQELLEISSCHVLHDNAVVVLILKLFFEADYVGAVFATRLNFDFVVDTSQFFLRMTARVSNHFDRELFIC